MSSFLIEVNLYDLERCLTPEFKADLESQLSSTLSGSTIERFIKVHKVFTSYCFSHDVGLLDVFAKHAFKDFKIVRARIIKFY